MNIRTIFLFLCISVFCFITVFSKQKNSCLIRILLERLHENTPAITIHSEAGFTLVDKTEHPVKKRRCHFTHLKIRFDGSHIVVNEKKYLKNKLYIVPGRGGHLSLADRTYDGVFLVLIIDNELCIVNIVDIEKYICSVLRTESWPGWPLEVNKVFAIACRSYVLSMIRDAQVAQRHYHVKNTNHHQTYHGRHDDIYIKDAVSQTKGVFLAHNNGPIVAMFDCCCGGVIPARIHGFNHADAPYLARDYPCTHCRPCKIYAWQATYSIQDFLDVLKRASIDKIDTIGKLISCTISKRDKAGIVQEIVLKGDKGSITLSGKKFYSLFKEVTSFCFSIHKKGNMILVKGKGYGHHRGLCQWGAREMVRHGWDYRRILEFYYPTTSFMQLI